MVLILLTVFFYQVSLLPDSALQWFGISSSASPQPNEKETSQSQGEGGSTTEKAAAAADSHIQDEKDESGFYMAYHYNMIKKAYLLPFSKKKKKHD